MKLVNETSRRKHLSIALRIIVWGGSLAFIAFAGLVKAIGGFLGLEWFLAIPIFFGLYWVLVWVDGEYHPLAFKREGHETEFRLIQIIFGLFIIVLLGFLIYLL